MNGNRHLSGKGGLLPSRRRLLQSATMAAAAFGTAGGRRHTRARPP
jgi:hypothetical protein